MKAAQIHSYGGVDVLKVETNVPEPIPQAQQVLVEVYAASINPADWKLREGYFKEYVPLQFPVTLGGDFSGVITKVGEKVARFQVGDEVYGQGGLFNGGSGSIAEYVVAGEDKIFAKPEKVDYLAAAALPLVGISAIQAIEDEMKVQSGQKVLIHGGAGGIGSISIQIAKTLGAYVATTVSEKDIDYVKALGADEVIDYKTQHFEELLKDFDAVFDTAGGETTTKSFQVLKKGGILVSMMGQPDAGLAEKYDVTVIGQRSETNPQRLNRLTTLVNEGKVKVNVDKVFSLDEVKEAFTYQEKSHPRGKVVVKIK